MISEVKRILLIIFLFSRLIFLAVAKIEKDFTFPVLIGAPSSEHIISVKIVPMSEKKALFSVLSLEIFVIESIIFLPPKSVETKRTEPTSKIIGRRPKNDPSLGCVPSKINKRAINFCPS